jgi:hypothetical protein
MIAFYFPQVILDRTDAVERISVCFKPSYKSRSGDSDVTVVSSDAVKEVYV